MASPPRRIFCDLDGVLADFEAGCVRVTGRHPSAYGKRDIGKMWRALARSGGFYDRLPWMADGRELWGAIRHLEPTILTGLPLGQWAEPQKRSWCARELGEGVEVICCMARDKHTFIRGPGDILIDDRERAEEPWVRAGGTFVLHESTERTVLQLLELGVLSADGADGA